MVEQMGVEPTTYTMRTYRSSQLSYCPTKTYQLIYTVTGKNQGGFLFFPKKAAGYPLLKRVGALSSYYAHLFDGRREAIALVLSRQEGIS